jgi:hypothetical protein
MGGTYREMVRNMVMKKLKWYHVLGIIAGGIITYEVIKAVHYDAHRPMIAFAKQYYEKPMRIAEIGVLWGTNSLRMFNNLDIESIYLIDPYLKYDEYDYKQVVILPDSFEPALTVLNEYNDRIIPLQMASEVAVDLLPSDLDMVYIDGNHAYNYVKKDIELYYPKIKSRGLIGGHDIDMNDVSSAVHEFADSNGLSVYIDSPDWWLIKP